jgi:hypothetical protein
MYADLQITVPGLPHPAIAQPSAGTEAARCGPGRPRRGILHLDSAVRINHDMRPERSLDTFNHQVLQHLDTHGRRELVQGP